MKKAQFLFIAFVLLIFSGAQAQFHWQVDHSYFEGNTYYSFDAISSFGNTCTVAGNIYDTVAKQLTHVFWRSTDAGVSWKLQDAGLPHVNYTKFERHLFEGIQQIDSLTAVAVGDSGLIVRTTDGGNSWEKQDCQNTSGIYEVNFSDKQNGILLAGWTIYTTFNGGKQWTKAPFTTNNIYSCYAHQGEGGFSVFKIPHGPIYTSKDNWNTVDSTSRFLDSLPDGSKYFFNYCNFTGGDTIIVYQEYIGIGGAIMRSTNFGKTWENPIITQGVTAIDYMTDIIRDTIIATGRGDVGNKILISTNRGASWRTDSIILDIPYNSIRAKGLTFTSNGSCIASFSNNHIKNLSLDSSILIHSKPVNEKVEWFGVVYYNQRIFPIPAMKTLSIANVEDAMPFSMIDILGRVVISGVLPSRNSLDLDVSMLPRGVYYVLVDNGKRGKVIIGKALLIY